MTLTSAERRGALALLAIFALGAARDLWVTRGGSRAALDRPAAAETAGPSTQAVTTAATPASAGAEAASALDLNRASAAELDGLPGVGPVLAGRIVEYRHEHGAFRTVEELTAVRGIGPRSFARLRPLVRVGARDATAGPGAGPVAGGAGGAAPVARAGR